MAITRQKKEEVVAQLKEIFETATAVIAADNIGMSVEQVTRLRNKAREAGCNVKVGKKPAHSIGLERDWSPGIRCAFNRTDSFDHSFG